MQRYDQVRRGAHLLPVVTVMNVGTVPSLYKSTSALIGLESGDYEDHKWSTRDDGTYAETVSRDNCEVTLNHPRTSAADALTVAEPACNDCANGWVGKEEEE